jgi:hypothetical protein
MQELNRIIDDKLPGRPPFQCHEVIVEGQAFEVYYRDVKACIQALFSDPEFAEHLKFRPE